MKKYIYACFLCFFLTMTVFLPAQTALEIEDLLKTDALNYEQTVRFVLKAADVTDPTGKSNLEDKAEAFRFAAEQNWLPGNVVSSDKTSLEGVSLLLMRSFDIKGGFFYSHFTNPHYAYREMVYQDIIQGRVDPEMAVSGEYLLFLVGRILARQGEAADLAFDSNMQKLLDAEAEQKKQSLEESDRRERERVVAEAKRAAAQQALMAEINTQLQSQAVEDTRASITDQGVTISLSNIQFLANSAELPDAEKRKLQEIGRILKTISKRKIMVAGHTALAGTASDRLRTSQERAEAVADYLVSLGARNADEIYAQGFGSDRPIADNNTPEGMALNRRVEITILEDQP